ncbi:MAG: T9SS type A sorting domain-containing protein [Ignavibacteria bacterium]|nr:T9SS type A sorting domain-containing protein [Ignavibacteria bacterium]
MKKVLSCLLFLLISQISFSQIYFEQLTELPSFTNKNLNGIYKFSNKVFVFGDSGTVFVSQDSCVTWNNIPTGVLYNFFGGVLISGANLIIPCSDGIIIKSTDYGVSWNVINTGFLFNIYWVQNIMNNLNYLLAGGDNGLLIQSTNGGQNWQQISTNTNLTLRSATIDQNLKRGVIVGDSGLIYKVDIIYPPIPPVYTITYKNSNTKNDLYSVIRYDTSKYFAVGKKGEIRRSNSAGNYWGSVYSGVYDNLYNIILSDSILIVVGDNGLLLKSVDSGIRWEKLNSNSNSTLKASLVQPENVVVVGNSGKYLKYYPNPNLEGTTLNYYKTFSCNRILTFFSSSGIFNRNFSLQNTSGFRWPSDSNKHAIFSTGITIAAKVNNQIRMASNGYYGELTFGYMNNQIPSGNPYYMIYRVKRGDNCNTNVSWANWAKMVPFGAPYVDVNNNKVFEPCIDTPGVKNASETMFIVLTDGFFGRHYGDVLGGGTAPLYANFVMTIWAYSDSVLGDVQFIKYKIINSSLSKWDSVFLSIFSDCDLGNASDDYIGCDTIRKLGFTYNADNSDYVYGLNPPAVGFRLLRTPINKNKIPYDTLGMSSFVTVFCNGCGAPSCEIDPFNEPFSAYNIMKGFKKDLSPWMDPTYSPPHQTKFIYYGDPETQSGWTENKGSVSNCGGTTGTIIPTNPPGDRRMVITSGKGDLSVLPGEYIVFVFAQLIKRGSNNLNSVTKLKEYSDLVAKFYYENEPKEEQNTIIPTSYFLYQNYPNPFNSNTKIKFDIPFAGNVELILYDVLGKKLMTLVNKFYDAGTYIIELNSLSKDFQLSSGIYFYQMKTKYFTDTKKMVLTK